MDEGDRSSKRWAGVGPGGSGPGLVLASASPRRRELLSLLGLPFRVVRAQVDEAAMAGERPARTAGRLALAKARAVAARCPGALVVGCDTVVALEGEMLGKPADAEEARAMLSRLRGRTHTVYTGIALVGEGQETGTVVATEVVMRAYTDAELSAYVASGDPLDKAGAYGIQHPLFHPVGSWNGCYANVMGLPLCHLARLLQGWGVVPPADVPAACQAHTGQRCAVAGEGSDYPHFQPQRSR